MLSHVADIQNSKIVPLNQIVTDLNFSQLSKIMKSHLFRAILKGYFSANFGDTTHRHLPHILVLSETTVKKVRTIN